MGHPRPQDSGAGMDINGLGLKESTRRLEIKYLSSNLIEKRENIQKLEKAQKSTNTSRALCGRLQPACLRPVVSAMFSVASLNLRPPSPGPLASRVFSRRRRIRDPDLKDLLQDYRGQPLAIDVSCLFHYICTCI